MPFRPQEVQSLRDRVYDALREAIITGALQPGQRIKEREVAAQMQISTTPVKEALRRLEQDGLVVSQPRRGAVVSNFALTNLEEIVEIRALLEGMAARLAAAKLTDLEIAALEQQLEQIARLTASGPPDRLFAANTEFHDIIRRAAHNHFINKFIESMRPFMNTVGRRALSYKEEAERGYAEHHAVYEALKKRDGARAERLMREHVRRTVKFVIERAEAKKDAGRVRQ